MIAIADILLEPARKANILVPEDLEDYNPVQFPHWHVFVNSQIGRSLPQPTSHWDNAEVIASLNNTEILTVSLGDLCDRGFV